jgi:hypothetical protein
MELDDLKQTWNQNPVKKIKNTDIMELIQHKSYGPLAALKREYKKQILLMSIVPILMFATGLDDINGILKSVLFWSYVVFCLCVAVYSYFNYRIVSKMEIMDGRVRSNLEQQIGLLETRMRWNMIGVRIVALFFILLLEVLPYFQHYRMLDKWHALNPFIRFGSYAAFFIIQYFTSRVVCKRRFGAHIEYLKELVSEMR